MTSKDEDMWRVIAALADAHSDFADLLRNDCVAIVDRAARTVAYQNEIAELEWRVIRAALAALAEHRLIGD